MTKNRRVKVGVSNVAVCVDTDGSVLKEFDIRGNLLSTVPAELGNCMGLEGFKLAGLVFVIICN